MWSLSPQNFTEKFAQDFQRRLSSDLQLIIQKDFHIVLRSGNTRVHVALETAYAEYQTDPDQLPKIVDRWVLSLAKTLAPPNSAIQTIVPVIKRRTWVSDQNAALRLELGGVPHFDPWTEPYNSELSIVYCDIADGISPVSTKDLIAAGKDLNSVREIAFANLSERLRDWKLVGSDGLFLLGADGNLEPSFLLTIDIWDDPRLRVEGDLVVGIPGRGGAWFSGTGHQAQLAKLAYLVGQDFTKAQYPVSPRLFVRRGHRFELLESVDDR